MNKDIILGCYYKLKSKIYYDSNMMIYKGKIASFESDDFDRKINDLAIFAINNYEDKHYLDMLLSQIAHFPQIKKIENKKVHLNFFIDAPVELLILDVYWTIQIANELRKQNHLSNNIYGNLIDDKALFDDQSNNINWHNKELFQKYIKGYNRWLKDAEKKILENKYIANHITAISCDLKRYYYSAKDSFSTLSNLIDKNNKELNFLTNIISTIHDLFRKELINNSNIVVQNGSFPIGLSSSMILSNAYLYDFDQFFNNHPSVLFYGRYVDDMIFVLNDKYTDKQFYNFINPILMRTMNNNQLKVNTNKTKTFDFTFTTFLDELDKFAMYFNQKQINYYSNDDEEVISYRRYINIGKKKLNNVMIDKGLIKEQHLLEIELVDAILFMNYIFTYVKISDETKSEIMKKIQIDVEENIRVSMWKEYFKWIQNFIHDSEEIIIKLLNSIRNSIKKKISLKIVDLRDYQVDKSKDLLLDTYEKILNTTLILSDTTVSMIAPGYDIFFTSAMIAKKTPIRLFIENIKKQNKLNNSLNFYKNQYKNCVSFIPLWEIVLYDQLVNSAYNKKKSVENSIKTFKIINKIHDFDYINTSKETVIRGLEVYKYRINGDTINSNKYVISHPNVVLDDKHGEPLNSYDREPSFQESTKMLNNLIEAKNNKTNLLVLPELFVFYEWIHFIGYTAQLFKMNISMGLKGLIVKKQYYNQILSLYSFEDIYKRRNLFPTLREKNFYSYEEIEWCDSNRFTCINKLVPMYNAVSVRNITYADYVCFEVTDIFSRAVFKGHVDVIVIPMLNKDTSYFDSIIYSLSRDMSCCVVTSNSASWGNSTIVLPKNTASRVLTEFKGGFNQYLVSSDVPIYELIDFNQHFIFPNKEKDSFKPHSANYRYARKIEDLDF